MGLFNKLKNVLFEEEIVEVPVEEPMKREIKTEEKVVERKRSTIEPPPSRVSEPKRQEKETFKAEKTFDFPVFDEEEFDDVKRVQAPREKEEPKKNSMSINLFDYEKPKMPPKKEKPSKKTSQEVKGRPYDTKEKELDAKKFRPSPVISPVYGVLDKNYTKEEIRIKKESKKAMDVDEARKKAFGPLEQEIEREMEEKPKTERKKRRYEPVYEEEKSIDDLLEETAFDTIEIPTDYKKEKQKFPDPEDYELERLDKKRKPKTEEEIIDSDDTLESDLFDLIDSMYENREDD